MDLILKDMQNTLTAYFQETIFYQKATKAIVKKISYLHIQKIPDKWMGIRTEIKFK